MENQSTANAKKPSSIFTGMIAVLLSAFTCFMGIQYLPEASSATDTIFEASTVGVYLGLCCFIVGAVLLIGNAVFIKMKDMRVFGIVTAIVCPILLFGVFISSVTYTVQVIHYLEYLGYEIIGAPYFYPLVTFIVALALMALYLDFSYRLPSEIDKSVFWKYIMAFCGIFVSSMLILFSINAFINANAYLNIGDGKYIAYFVLATLLFTMGLAVAATTIILLAIKRFSVNVIFYLIIGLLVGLIGLFTVAAVIAGEHHSFGWCAVELGVFLTAITAFIFCLIAKISVGNNRKKTENIDMQFAQLGELHIFENLTKYKELLDIGAITQEEYDKIKAGYLEKFLE